MPLTAVACRASQGWTTCSWGLQILGVPELFPIQGDDRFMRTPLLYSSGDRKTQCCCITLYHRLLVPTVCPDNSYHTLAPFRLCDLVLPNVSGGWRSSASASFHLSLNYRASLVQTLTAYTPPERPCSLSLPFQRVRHKRRTGIICSYRTASRGYPGWWDERQTCARCLESTLML